MAWLRLIRWTNLLIIGFTQLLAWWCVVVPLGRHRGQPLLLTPLNFSLLALSTLLIAAAGYIINDYFDIRMDVINKPDKVILERQIPRRMAIIVHSVLNALAVFLAAMVARQTGSPEWLLLQLLCAFLLWKYSTTYKRQFMTGNIIVALMTGLTIVALIIYEPELHAFILKPPMLGGFGCIDPYRPNPVYVLGVYTYFAFMLTWMREIVKDMEDYKGDAEEGCVTMPIRWGLLRSSRFTQFLSLAAIIPLAMAGAGLLRLGTGGIGRGSSILGWYILVALILPLLIWTYYLPRKATTRHYRRASRQLKWIMVAGVASLVLYMMEYG